jgi:ABC-type antimicrobial peptide transport system permease subunit
MAILKALGFQPLHILGIVVGEGLLVGAASGALGATLAFGLSALNATDQLPFSISYLKSFPVTHHAIIQGLLVGGLVGFAGSLIPAWNARNVKAAEVFARVT